MSKIIIDSGNHSVTIEEIEELGIIFAGGSTERAYRATDLEEKLAIISSSGNVADWPDDGQYEVSELSLKIMLPKSVSVDECVHSEGTLTVNDAWNATVEIRGKDDAGNLIPISIANAQINVTGTFGPADAEVVDGSVIDVSCGSDNLAGYYIRLSGPMRFESQTGDSGQAVNIILVSHVDSDTWSLWKDGTDAQTLNGCNNLVISGGFVAVFPSEDSSDRTVVIAGSDEYPVKLEVPTNDESYSGAFLVRHTVSQEASLFVKREADNLILSCENEIQLVSGETVWVVEKNGTITISGDYTDNWETVGDGPVSEAFTITGGTARRDEEGNLIIVGDADHPVDVELGGWNAGDMCLVQYQGTLGGASAPLGPLPVALGVILLALCAVAAVVSLRLRAERNRLKAMLGEKRTQIQSLRDTELRESAPGKAADMGKLEMAKLQNIGRRRSQQDCLGAIPVQGGFFAVVADGMGGLSDGDKVSQKIVQTMIQDASKHSADQMAENLTQMVAHANSEVNQMLGYNKLYKSGSTLIAVLAQPGRFSWISVGDSRIYLYRAGSMLQINHEHSFEVELLTKAVNHEISFYDAKNNEKKKSVTSFIGMGELKYIDFSLKSVCLQRGDRILLMSDGVFNTLSEPEMAKILSTYADSVEAAAAIETAVLAHNSPHQDNFSAVIIDYR